MARILVTLQEKMVVRVLRIICDCSRRVYKYSSKSFDDILKRPRALGQSKLNHTETSLQVNRQIASFHNPLDTFATLSCTFFSFKLTKT